MFIWNSLAVSIIQRMLAIWSLVPLPFLNPACTSGSSVFMHCLMRNECNCAVVWTFFGIALLWDWNGNCLFPVLDHCWVFQICCHIECSTWTASSFTIWNSATGIPSLPPALFIVILPKAHLTSFCWLSGSTWVITPSWLSGSLRSFLYSSVYSCHLFLISFASVRSILFLFFFMSVFAWKQILQMLFLWLWVFVSLAISYGFKILLSYFHCLLQRKIVQKKLFPGGSVVKKLLVNAEDVGSIPESGRSLGGGHDNPLQYTCLENSKNRGNCWATVHGVAKELDMT